MEWREVLKFWFEEAGPEKWFAKSDAFDEEIRTRFLATYERAVAGQTASWRADARGRLAEVIVLDQFPRNMFRNSGKAFATDAAALRLAEEAVALGLDKALSPRERHFLYMPYMHSESKRVHWKALWLFLHSMNWGALVYEWKHKRVIDRFGRYPHRNAALGRVSTPEEVAFIAAHPGF
jgi:uncharacterized protein (DUF924 family)